MDLKTKLQGQDYPYRATLQKVLVGWVTKKSVIFLTIPKDLVQNCAPKFIIGIKIGYIPSSIGKTWIAETQEISAMSTGLMKYLSND